jgi:hypothetical protein
MFCALVIVGVGLSSCFGLPPHSCNLYPVAPSCRPCLESLVFFLKDGWMFILRVAFRLFKMYFSEEALKYVLSEEKNENMSLHVNHSTINSSDSKLQCLCVTTPTTSSLSIWNRCRSDLLIVSGVWCVIICSTVLFRLDPDVLY